MSKMSEIHLIAQEILEKLTTEGDEFGYLYTKEELSEAPALVLWVEEYTNSYNENGKASLITEAIRELCLQ